MPYYEKKRSKREAINSNEVPIKLSLSVDVKGYKFSVNTELSDIDQPSPQWTTRDILDIARSDVMHSIDRLEQQLHRAKAKQDIITDLLGE